MGPTEVAMSRAATKATTGPSFSLPTLRISTHLAMLSRHAPNRGAQEAVSGTRLVARGPTPYWPTFPRARSRRA